MNKKNILIVTNPEKMNENLFNWIDKTDTFDMSFAESHEKAIELSHQQLFDMVLVDGTDPEINTKKLKAVLPILNSEVLLVGYQGGEADELDEIVKGVFEWRKLKRMQKLLVLESAINPIPPFSLN